MNLTELLEAGKLETLRGAPLQIEAGTFEGGKILQVFQFNKHFFILCCYFDNFIRAECTHSS